MKAEDRARQILSCAKRVFAERGFHAANISHICAEAGIGRGTLYQYFENKKAVFTAILRDSLGRVQALMETFAAERAAAPPPETLTREEMLRYSASRLRRLLEIVFEDEPTLRILLREAVGLDVDVEKVLGEIDDGIIGIVEADLAMGQKDGFIRADLSPRHTATLMVGGVEKLALAALRSEERVDLRQLAREVARLHLVGTVSDRVPPAREREE